MYCCGRSRILGVSVAYFDRAVADSHLRGHDRAVRRRHPHPLHAFERRLQKLDELSRGPHDDVRRDGRQSRPLVMNGSRLRFPRPCWWCSYAFAHGCSPLPYNSCTKTPVDGQQKYVRLSFSPVDRLKEHMPSPKSEVLQGTLDLLILKTLATMGPLHGFGIALRIQQVSKDLLQLNQGTLYPALLRHEQRGWITSKWGISENNRKAKFYSLTRAGRKQLEEEAESWDRMSNMINHV